MAASPSPAASPPASATSTPDMEMHHPEAGGTATDVLAGQPEPLAGPPPTDPTAAQPADLEAGASSGSHAEHLRLGGFKVVDLVEVPRVTLEWQDVWLTAPLPKDKVAQDDPTVRSIGVNKWQKDILGGVSGFARPGEMLGILGVTGAGKTSLLNVLARRNRKNTGSITINGQPLTDDYAAIVAFLQQDDLFFGNLTVRQHLLFQARLRMGEVYSDTEKERYVDDLIIKLGLGKARHNMIGSVQQNLARGISGGERKRLGFATEIMTNPSLLVVDEPTTGLDAWLADGVMRTLKSIANAGRTVVLTIHQPSSDAWALLDRVYLMVDGRCVFFGRRDVRVFNTGSQPHSRAAQDAVAYFSRLNYQCPHYSNPADFLVKVLASAPQHSSTAEAYEKDLQSERERLTTIKDAWTHTALEDKAEMLPPDEKAISDSIAVKPASKFKTSWFQQLRILMQRAMIYELTDRLLFRARAVQTLLLSLIIGLIYLQLGTGQANVQDRNGVMYFMMISQSLFGMIGVLQTFPFEWPVFQREYENGLYSCSAFYLAKLAASLIPQLLFPCVFTTITFWMIGIRDDVIVWLWALLIVIMVAQSAMSLGYVISMAAENVTVALAFAPVILMPLLIFGGLMINVDSVPDYFVWLQAVSFFQYGFSAFAGVVWDGFKLECPAPPRPCPYPSGNAVLNYLHFDTANRPRDFLVLAAITVVLRAATFILMRYKASKRQNES